MWEYIKNRKIKKFLFRNEKLAIKVLHEYARFYCRKKFGIKFKCFIMFDNEKDLIGKFVSIFDVPFYIAIGRDFYYKAEPNELFQIFEHELIHYSLCKLGLPYRDDDDYFIRTCELLEVPTEYVKGRYYEN